MTQEEISTRAAIWRIIGELDPKEALRRLSASSCSACERQYSKGYAAGRRKSADVIRGQYVLRLRDGGEVIIRGANVIDSKELVRIQGWVAQQLVIQQNAKGLPSAGGEPSKTQKGK